MAKKPRAMSEAIFRQMLDETFVIVRKDFQCLAHPFDKGQVFVTSNRIFAEAVAKETKNKVLSLNQALTEQMHREAKQASEVIESLLAKAKKSREKKAKTKTKLNSIYGKFAKKPKRKG